LATTIALLRAVNVGGTPLAMADLASAAAAAGLGAPRTLLQTGNLVFEDDSRPDAAVESLIEAALAERLGLATDVFVRNAEDWRAVVAANPFPREAADAPTQLVVMALKTPVAPERMELLRSAIKGREYGELRGRELFLVYPDGIGRSKLTIGVIEKALGTRATGRNWNTVLKLAAMAGVGTKDDQA
jgi:uncharacterized protein (DUF1697 family)